ncbi:hypothetical protein [Dongia deserti]|uniref:hypothetical protein n=1 Tax=Dongia deserti TaxID=2268030 RepID=UPI000E646BFF|nr:hypothetical protein [Dongia deserti]
MPRAFVAALIAGLVVMATAPDAQEVQGGAEFNDAFKFNDNALNPAQTPGFNDGSGYKFPIPGLGQAAQPGTLLSSDEVSEVVALCKAAQDPANYEVCKRFKVGTAP